jgi:hypothetical protein
VPLGSVHCGRETRVVEKPPGHDGTRDQLTAADSRPEEQHQDNVRRESARWRRSRTWRTEMRHRARVLGSDSELGDVTSPRYTSFEGSTESIQLHTLHLVSQVVLSQSTAQTLSMAQKYLQGGPRPPQGRKHSAAPPSETERTS